MLLWLFAQRYQTMVTKIFSLLCICSRAVLLSLCLGHIVTLYLCACWGTACPLPALWLELLDSWLVQQQLPGGTVLNISLTATLDQRNDPSLDPPI